LDKEEVPLLKRAVGFSSSSSSSSVVSIGVGTLLGTSWGIAGRSSDERLEEEGETEQDEMG
jgi:hypothetical protein